MGLIVKIKMLRDKPAINGVRCFLLLSLVSYSSLKLNLIGHQVSLSSFFILISLILLVIAFLRKEILLSKLFELKKELIFCLVILLLTILGTIASLLYGLPIEGKIVGLEYIRLISVLWLFLLIGIVNDIENKFLISAVFIFLLQLIFTPLIYIIPELFVSENRFVGLFDDPNYFANTYLLVFFLVLYLTKKFDKNILKVTSYLFLSLVAGLLLWSGSRGAWLGLGAGIVFLFLVTFQKSKKVAIFYVLLSLSAFMLGNYLLPNLGNDQLKERINSITRNSNNPTSVAQTNQARGTLWLQSARLVAENPLGYGAGYASILVIEEENGTRQNSHNLFLEIVLSGGIGLGLLFLGGFIFLAKKSWMLLKTTDWELIAIVIAAFIAIITSAMFLDTLVTKPMWVLAAFLVFYKVNKEIRV